MSIVRQLADIFFGPSMGKRVEAERWKIGVERKRGDEDPPDVAMEKVRAAGKAMWQRKRPWWLP